MRNLLLLELLLCVIVFLCSCTSAAAPPESDSDVHVDAVDFNSWTPEDQDQNDQFDRERAWRDEFMTRVDAYNNDGDDGIAHVIPDDPYMEEQEPPKKVGVHDVLKLQFEDDKDWEEVASTQSGESLNRFELVIKVAVPAGTHGAALWQQFNSVDDFCPILFDDGMEPSCKFNGVQLSHDIDEQKHSVINIEVCFSLLKDDQPVVTTEMIQSILALMDTMKSSEYFDFKPPVLPSVDGTAVIVGKPLFVHLKQPFEVCVDDFIARRLEHARVDPHRVRQDALTQVIKQMAGSIEEFMSANRVETSVEQKSRGRDTGPNCFNFEVETSVLLGRISDDGDLALAYGVVENFCRQGSLPPILVYIPLNPTVNWIEKLWGVRKRDVCVVEFMSMDSINFIHAQMDHV